MRTLTGCDTLCYLSLLAAVFVLSSPSWPSAAELTHAQIEKKIAEAPGTAISLTNLDFIDANLSGLNLRGADFFSTKLSGATLAKADLSLANFTRPNFRTQISPACS